VDTGGTGWLSGEMTCVLHTRAAAIAALLLSSCGTTKLSQTWHDPADTPVLVNRVLVVAIQLPGETLEARFANVLAAVIRREGFRPLTASSTFAPRHRDRETMVKYMRDHGGDLAIQLEMVTGTSSTLIPASLAWRSMSRTADLKSEQDSAESLVEAVVKVLTADGVLVR
jgi:hypothetical protein